MLDVQLRGRPSFPAFGGHCQLDGNKLSRNLRHYSIYLQYLCHNLKPQPFFLNVPEVLGQLEYFDSDC